MLNPRLLIVTGKGGTGRSAVAAALARSVSTAGERVLALALDGGDGLARHLDAATFGPLPAVHAGVHGAAVTPADALDEYLRLRVRIPRIGAATRIFAAVVETVPGVRDTVMIGKALYESERGGWDRVVVDAPPTGQVQSLLAAPATIGGLVPSGRVREQGEWMARLLADPAHTGVVVVATPEELAVVEAGELISTLAVGAEATVSAVVANRVLPPPGAEPEPGIGADAWRLQRDLAEAQAPRLDALRPTHRLPFLYGVAEPAEVARRLATVLQETG